MRIDTVTRGVAAMRHYEESGAVEAGAERLFVHLDEHTQLSSHMSKSSWRMGGGRMHIELDEGLSKRVGSHIRLTGKVFGIALSVDEIVTEREPPLRKIWQTVGSPRMLVIASYRLGFDVAPHGPRSVLRVFIDYALPRAGLARWCGVLLGDFYARWCVHRMLSDAVTHFERARNGTASRPVSSDA